MLDGLGLVYEKRGNTGAAAYNQPSNADPFAAITEDLQGRVEGIRKEEQRKKDNIDKANELIIQDIDPKGWDIDNRKIFYQKGLDLKKEAAILRTKGKNLSDPTDPEVMAFQRKQQEVLNQANSSAEQGKLFDPVYKEFIAKPDRYDQEKTLANIERFKALPFEERINVDPRTLLEKKFDKFAAVKPVKNFSDFTDVSPLKGTIIRPERIDAYLEEQIQSPDVQESIQMGIEQGAWNDVQGWRKAMTNHIKSLIPLKANEYREPKGSGPDDENINISLNLDETANLPFMNLDVKTKKPTGQFTDATMRAPTTLGSGNFTIASGDVMTTQSGKSNSTIPYLLPTGTLAIGIKHKDGKYMKEGAGVNIMENGKVVTISMQEALRRGIVKYEPVVYGMAETVGKNDVTGEDKKQQVSITVPAKKLKNTITGVEPKEAKNIILQIEAAERAAEELNKRAGYKAGTSATPKAQTAAPKTKEAKMSFPEWKAKNPNGTPAQFKAYKNS